MINIRNLIAKLSSRESRLRTTTFVAPCLRGRPVRARVEGIAYAFNVVPEDFEGWGVFRPIGVDRAELVSTAHIEQIDAYLRGFSRMRVRLAIYLSGDSWLAYPANVTYMTERFQLAEPITVHLAEGGGLFEQVFARCDGASWWYEEIDRSADPLHAEKLREALDARVAPDRLSFSGATPEMRSAYALAISDFFVRDSDRRRRFDRKRLIDALEPWGGTLLDFQDEEEYWIVTWSTADSARYSSMIAKSDLTVIDAGICLNDEDRAFDLQSLIGVVERRPEWMQ